MKELTGMIAGEGIGKAQKDRRKKSRSPRRI
jgi:hypothetical protein